MNQQALESKKNAVKAIEESFNGSASFIVVSYQGLTVAELSALRKELEKTDGASTADIESAEQDDDFAARVDRMYRRLA